MTHDPRPHIRRRRRAIGRLRSLTASAAIAGLAGTAGFGLLAAASWSGDSAAGATGGSTGATNGTSGTSGTSGTNGKIRPQATPDTGGSARQPTTTAPDVRRGSGPGHASSGGSH